MSSLRFGGYSENRAINHRGTASLFNRGSWMAVYIVREPASDGSPSYPGAFISSGYPLFNRVPAKQGFGEAAIAEEGSIDVSAETAR